jgi:alpha-L-fucosidase
MYSFMLKYFRPQPFQAQLLVIVLLLPMILFAQNKPSQNVKPLSQLQQEFVDLRFGMFIHFNIPTYMDQDWADPEASPSIFNPKKLDCEQWAKAAKSANMSYGCLTTKHHSGFAIWDTKTTDYNVMNSPLKRDVVKEYVNAFRKNGLKVMLYYSILDTHHQLRPNQITADHIKMVKAQLTELLNNYGAIDALIIDGWDAPWSRISYDDIPFEEIYTLIKSIQPNCLVMDLNAAKYPAEALYYTDIKSYEQGAGQHISKDTNKLPALSCLPLQKSWFWKTSFPVTPVKDALTMVNDNIIPFNNAYCNFILNVAPNRDGLIDDNAIAALKEIGKAWKTTGPTQQLPATETPIISPNIAKFQPANSSWSDDMNIMDFANDDNFNSTWQSNSTIKNPWFELDFKGEKAFNMIVIADKKDVTIKKYSLQYRLDGVWKTVFSGENASRIKFHRFKRVYGDSVRILVEDPGTTAEIAEFGIFNERRN